MTLNESILEVFGKPPEHSTPVRIRSLLERMQQRFALNYIESYRKVVEVVPDMTIGDYDTYCYRADSAEEGG